MKPPHDLGALWRNGGQGIAPWAQVRCSCCRARHTSSSGANLSGNRPRCRWPLCSMLARPVQCSRPLLLRQPGHEHRQSRPCCRPPRLQSTRPTPLICCSCRRADCCSAPDLHARDTVLTAALDTQADMEDADADENKPQAAADYKGGLNSTMVKPPSEVRHVIAANAHIYTCMRLTDHAGAS